MSTWCAAVHVCVWVCSSLRLNLQERELNIFLDDLLKHVKPDSAYKNLQPQLFAIIQKIMTHSKSMEKTLTMVRVIFNQLSASRAAAQMPNHGTCTG